MWVMPITAFIELDKLQPHQILRASNKIVQYNERMSTVFFLSHQCAVCCVCGGDFVCRTQRRVAFTTGTPRASLRWTGFSHPDDTLEQLRTMQRLFLRMMAGDVMNTEPNFESRIYLPKAHKVTTSQWAALVPEAYIWMVRVQTVASRVDRT